MIDEDEWKKTNNFLMYPLKLIRPGFTRREILQAAAAHWGEKMEATEREELAEDVKRSYGFDLEIDSFASESVAAGLQALGYKIELKDPARGMSSVQRILKGDPIIRIREDYFRSWFNKHWSDRFFTTVCAILSKVGSKRFCEMSLDEIAARQVGTTDRLEEINHITMSRQELRTQVNKILEKGILSQVVYHRGISFFSSRLRGSASENAVLEYKMKGANRKGLEFQLNANHFNKKQPHANHLPTTCQPL